jgi:hypothetical protein
LREVLKIYVVGYLVRRQVAMVVYYR